MLYVFHVDAGTMATFDMNIALESVSHLKQAIEKKTKIPASSVVLLVNGGEVLTLDAKVCSYSAGTDTNPIYMFCKNAIKDENSKQAQQYAVDYECDLSPIVDLSPSVDLRQPLDFRLVPAVDLKPSVEACCALPPCLSTVASCAQLAQQFSEHAREYARNCEQLVHDQHLQHQGWAAVVANLEDIYEEFYERSKNFKEIFREHRQKKEVYAQHLLRLNDDLEMLSKIPLLDALQSNAVTHRFSAFDDFERSMSQTRASTEAGQPGGPSDFGVNLLKMSHEEDDIDKQSTSQDLAKIQEDFDEGVVFTAKSQGSDKTELTLLNWIYAKESQASLEDIVGYCQKGLALMEGSHSSELEAELIKLLEFANSHGLKHIKGIEDRLYGLDELLSDVKKIEREQNDLANALLQNQQRVSHLSDPSVLPMLCTSHRLQLGTMLKNHDKLVDIRKRCAKSKEELGNILKARLGTVLKIENLMSIQDAHDMLNYQCFNRLKKYFDIVEQLQEAPVLFCNAVYEVVRRRTFSQAFLTWASDVACHLMSIYNEEVMRRREFNSRFDGHFLMGLFPGTEDIPPPYGTQAPSLFDSKLPKLTQSDADYISKEFPILTQGLKRYDITSVVEFFKSRSAIADKSEDKEISDERLEAIVKESGIDRAFESETETEGFEKLSRQSTADKGVSRVDVSTLCEPERVSTATVTEVRPASQPLSIIPEHCHANATTSHADEFEPSEFYIEESLPSSLEWGRDVSSPAGRDLRQENMDTYKQDIEKLELQMKKQCGMLLLCSSFLRTANAELRNQVIDYQKLVREQCAEFLTMWEQYNVQATAKFREETQKLMVDHELELSDLRSEYDEVQKDQQQRIKSLSVDLEGLRKTLNEKDEQRKELESTLNKVDQSKQKELREIQDKMYHEYKDEIESLRSRFRLVAQTNMDRSPSESSLEKIERTDVIEIASHNAILLLTKENMEAEKEKAITEALEKHEQEWRQKYDTEMNALKVKYETEKQVTLSDAVRRIIDEKDRQLSQCHARETQLIKECTKYKDTIQQLTDPETNDGDSLALIKSQLMALENEKVALKDLITKLQKELESKNERSAMQGAEGALVDRLRDCSTSTEAKGKQKLVKSHGPPNVQSGSLSLSSPNPGDTVLLIWDAKHSNYTVLQLSSNIYFVHIDCLPALDLKIDIENESQRKLYAIGKFESKEFCSAKKEVNRYNVAEGTRFYRVRVKPIRGSGSSTSSKESQGSRHTPRKHHGTFRPANMPIFSEPRPVRWLTYLHSPESVHKAISTEIPSTSTRSSAERSTKDKPTTTASEDPTSSSDLDKVDGSRTDTTVKQSTSELEASTSVCMEDSSVFKSQSENAKLDLSITDGAELSVALGKLQIVKIESSDDTCLASVSSSNLETQKHNKESKLFNKPLDSLGEKSPALMTVSTQSIITIPEVSEHKSTAEDVIYENMESEMAEEATP